jgi:HD-GYP domain-containing protein (c-di-GMP phosphodiesterase class II)
MPTLQDNVREAVSDARAARLIEIGIALSAETNLERLLERIVSHARELTDADAGTLYIVDDAGLLQFKIIQNDTLGIRQGGAALRLDPVAVDRSTVSGYVALTGESVNIEDVYASDKFDFTGPKRYDKTTGYRSRSMLVVPMRDHEGNVIGVLQLLNARVPGTGEVVVFPREVEALTTAFASQAAVAITNARLIHEVRQLFDALIRVLAVAVDAKSPYTGNHVQRVAVLNLMLARAINEAGEGPFADVRFTEKELEEVRLAGWLHDVGKVTTPTWVMDKARKLETVFDRIELLQARFALIREKIENAALRARLSELGETAETLRASPLLCEARRKMDEVAEDLAFLERVNEPREFMDDQMLARLRGIAAKRYSPKDGEERPCLTEDEVENLSIRKGSLNAREIDLMRDHVRATASILREVPFETTRHLKSVAIYARQHHEKPNSRGYPEGLGAKDLSLQSRILAVADFYEALSAKDRPYKKPMPVDVILKILRSAAADGELDVDVLELMISEKVHERFEEVYEKAKVSGGKS